jgi:hypothetical protein
MSQEPGLAPGQDFHNPGYLILTWNPPAAGLGAVQAVTLQINPAHAWIVQPQYAPIQRINIADNGKIHVFQLSTAEELHYTIEIRDLPYDDNPVPQLVTNGFQSLRHFIRSTLNYSQELVTITTPDGEVEVMRYVGGIETMVEAAGQAQRHLYWSGQLNFRRQL